SARKYANWASSNPGSLCFSNKQFVYTVQILDCGSGKNIHAPVRCSSTIR
ncbi:hypothetical protein L9F63_020649, partial [Diploptera punctata]